MLTGAGVVNHQFDGRGRNGRALVGRNPNSRNRRASGRDSSNPLFTPNKGGWPMPDWSGIHDNWRSLGGPPTGARGLVTAVARKPDHLDLFVIGHDGRVYTAWWVAGSDWSGWRAIGGFFPRHSSVTVVARTPDNLDLFVVGDWGTVYTSWWSQGNDWSGVNDSWRSLGGFFPSSRWVAAVARTPHNLDLFMVGGDGQVYTSWWSE
jgi:hypothetical protein